MRHAACFAMLALTACGRPSAVPAPVVPTTGRISPSATRYLVTEHRHVEQVLRGQPIVTDATTRVVMTVVLDSAAQGFLLDARVDSAEVAGDAGFSGNVAPGARFVGRLSKGGIVLELTPPANGTDLLEQIALGLHDLVPHLPPEGASAGTTWHDTTTVRGLTAGMPITLERRSLHQADAWIVGDGERMLPVTTVTDYSFTGEGERSGQWITVAGTGVTHHRRFITVTGTVTLGARTDTLIAEVELSGSGLRIPLTQIRTDTVRRVHR